MGKLTIIGVEGAASSVTVVSQFNPKEISVDRSVPWQLQQAKGPGDLAFTSAEGRSMSFELMFDGVESRTHIQDEIGKLQRLSEADPSLKRPPKVKIVWGAEGAPGMMPKFEGVIESINVKYTMFDDNGRPLRAAVGLRFREARTLAVARLSKAKSRR
jgi:contractile injection system tube protein